MGGARMRTLVSVSKRTPHRHLPNRALSYPQKKGGSEINHTYHASISTTVPLALVFFDAAGLALAFLVIFFLAFGGAAGLFLLPLALVARVVRVAAIFTVQPLSLQQGRRGTFSLVTDASVDQPRKQGAFCV